MSVLNLIKRILGKKGELEILESQGFIHGKNFRMHGYVDSNWPWLISVGDNVCLASDCKILAHDASTNIVDCHTKIGIVEIGNNVFIGSRAVVLCNTRIGDNVIVAANSVVNRDLEPNGVYGGVPAKFICSIEEYKSKNQEAIKTHELFNEIPWNAWMDASPKKKKEMREKLKDTYGYV